MTHNPGIELPFQKYFTSDIAVADGAVCVVGYVKRQEESRGGVGWDEMK